MAATHIHLGKGDATLGRGVGIMPNGDALPYIVLCNHQLDPSTPLEDVLQLDGAVVVSFEAASAVFALTGTLSTLGFQTMRDMEGTEYSKGEPK